MKNTNLVLGLYEDKQALNTAQDSVTFGWHVFEVIPGYAV